MEITIEHARKVLDVVDCGLTKGMGVPQRGRMCVEAAICFALGLPHGDNPECVHPAVRAFKIRLNDAAWSSKDARAKGMRRVAVAQLGSEGIDGAKFRRIVVEQTIRRIVPMALRAAAQNSRNANHRDALLAAAERCVQDDNYRAAVRIARAAAYAAAAYAAAAAAAYAAAAYAAAAAAAYAAAADAAAAASSASDAAASDAADKVLTESADICLQALRECGSPGVALLDQIEAEAA